MADTLNPTDKVRTNGKWQQKSENLMETAQDAYESARDQGKEIISRANKTAQRWVSDYPMQAALGGLAVGFLLGAGLFRRR